MENNKNNNLKNKILLRGINRLISDRNFDILYLYHFQKNHSENFLQLLVFMLFDIILQ